MRKTLGLLALLAVAAPAFAGEPVGWKSKVWIAVGPEELTAEVAPLAELRRSQGFSVRILPKFDPEKLPTQKENCDLYVLLVGDDDPTAKDAKWRVPTPRRKLYRWREPQRQEFAADALLGDQDEDLQPDFAVGRIPARTPEEVRIVVQKTLAFEKRPMTNEDLRVVAWAGAPGYGGLVDSMATGILVSTVRKNSPLWAERFLISSAKGNPLCGWPPDQPDRFNEEYKKGALVGAFCAHANEKAVYGMEHEGKGVWYLLQHAKLELSEGPPLAPLLFLTCNSGRFDGRRPCLAEQMLFLPGGPVATIAATTESHPLTNYFTGRAFLRALAGKERELGAVWVGAQKKARVARNWLMEKTLKNVEGSLEEDIHVDSLRRDQMLMYAILGDPATRLKKPIDEPFPVEVTKTEKGFEWSAKMPNGATSIEIGWRPLKPEPGPAAPPKNADEARARLDKANAQGAFTPLPAPKDMEPWRGVIEKPGYVRVIVRGIVPQGDSYCRIFTAKLE